MTPIEQFFALIGRIVSSIVNIGSFWLRVFIVGMIAPGALIIAAWINPTGMASRISWTMTLLPLVIGAWFVWQVLDIGFPRTVEPYLALVFAYVLWSNRNWLDHHTTAVIPFMALLPLIGIVCWLALMRSSQPIPIVILLATRVGPMIAGLAIIYLLMGVVFAYMPVVDDPKTGLVGGCIVLALTIIWLGGKSDVQRIVGIVLLCCVVIFAWTKVAELGYFQNLVEASTMHEARHHTSRDESTATAVVTTDLAQPNIPHRAISCGDGEDTQAQELWNKGYRQFYLTVRGDGICTTPWFKRPEKIEENRWGTTSTYSHDFGRRLEPNGSVYVTEQLATGKIMPEYKDKAGVDNSIAELIKAYKFRAVDGHPVEILITLQ
jgi:hypothetical protein